MLLENTSEDTGHYLYVRLRQIGGNTHALGARAYVTAGGQTQMAEVGSSASYLSQDQLLLHFGLGDSEKVDRLRIVWPDGTEESHEDVTVDRVATFVHEAEYSSVLDEDGMVSDDAFAVHRNDVDERSCLGRMEGSLATLCR
ncbi:MAG: ASPIC/UnbV domain-containing protein [Planctomycetes bacterium]|nr:ASPIC/UnbV domain-containing protein [Planctomycetota bacterium]